MTISYIPFLKLKTNEIMAIKELDADLRKSLTPFFDFPYKNNRTEQDFKNTADRIFRSISRHLGDIPCFYLDNYDVDSNLIVDGGNSYAYLLEICEDLPIVPVISIDRTSEHVEAVCDAKDSGLLDADIIALRFIPEDFENYSVVDEDIREKLSDAIEKFDDIHLVFDCRICLNQDIDSFASNIINFIEQFSNEYFIDKVVVAGSSIPASISEILSTHNEVELERCELELFERIYQEIDNNDYMAVGDYTIVGPNYSDVDLPPHAIYNVITAKILYTFDDKHFVIRGGGIKTHARHYQQYNDLAAIIVAKPFFRGASYSFGDNYIDEKSRNEGSGVTQSTILKPTINSHITYMLRDYTPA